MKIKPKPLETVGTILVESEPNNDLLNPNVLPLNKWVVAEISSESDTDHFKITTLKKYRDIYKFELQNLSKELKPFIIVFDKNKRSLLTELEVIRTERTPGQNFEYTKIFEPGMVYYFRIYGEELHANDRTHGAYRLTVSEKQPALPVPNSI